MTNEQVQQLHEEETGKKSTWQCYGQTKYSASYSEWMENRLQILMEIKY